LGIELDIDNLRRKRILDVIITDSDMRPGDRSDITLD